MHVRSSRSNTTTQTDDKTHTVNTAAATGMLACQQYVLLRTIGGAYMELLWTHAQRASMLYFAHVFLYFFMGALVGQTAETSRNFHTW